MESSMRQLTTDQVIRLTRKPGTVFYVVDKINLYTIRVISDTHFIYTWMPREQDGSIDDMPNHPIQMSTIEKWLADSDVFFDNYWFAYAQLMTNYKRKRKET